MATSVTLCRWKMPVEREFKYVLRLSDEVEQRFLKPYPDDPHLEVNHHLIRQAYITENARIRGKQHCSFVGGLSQPVSDPPEDFYFTFKKFVEGHGVIEIETRISRDDFEALWTTTTNRLVKRRYCYYSSGSIWDVDFFINDGHTYFAMAECELQEDDADPLNLIPAVEETVIYAVDEHDTRFTSHALSDPAWAAKLMQEIAA